MKAEYRNVLMEAGYSAEQIEKRIEAAWQEMFCGSDRIYHETGEDMAYIEDTGNHDARTEGMSYGMMMCVQLDKKEAFDRLWKWTYQNMYMDSGYHKGYFAWSVSPEGVPNAYGPAPDGKILADKALHPVAIIATNAQASLAVEAPLSTNAIACVKSFWETPLRKGERRYYDNCLYMFALLALSGNYRIW